jgi:hypothetical protein
MRGSVVSAVLPREGFSNPQASFVPIRLSITEQRGNRAAAARALDHHPLRDLEPKWLANLPRLSTVHVIDTIELNEKSVTGWLNSLGYHILAVAPPLLYSILHSHQHL